jgi:beta-lactamase superfamily II metal-dependent hydrolase
MTMKSTAAFLVAAAAFVLMPLLQAADTLDIYVLDAEGGKAQIVKTPSGQAVLFDAGFPSADDRDIKRIEATAKVAGITAFDYFISTHYDVDHAGNIPALAARVPIKVFVDHGPMIVDPKMNPRNKAAGEAYLAFVTDKKRMTVKPGDAIPLKDVKVTILTSNEQVLAKALAGAGKPNAACPATPPVAAPADDNSGSVGELWEFGKFKMADFGDLLRWVENRLVCPTDKVGNIDLYISNHHGVTLSNSKEFLAALEPKVIIMDNGDRKGNAVETQQIYRAGKRLQDIWQMHKSPAIPAELTPADNFLANLSATDDQGYMIKVSARKDGSFTVTNGRNNFSKEYR